MAIQRISSRGINVGITPFSLSSFGDSIDLSFKGSRKREWVLYLGWINSTRYFKSRLVVLCTESKSSWKIDLMK